MKTQAGSLEMIRHLNQNLVLGIIRREEPVSRAQIAKELNLSRSTVSQIVDWLLENELIYEAGMEETSAKACGRPGQMLRYNPVSSYILGVHLTHRESRLCLADLRGNPIASSDYPPVADAEDVHAAIQDILKTSGIPQEKVSRISISVPGSVNAEGKVLRCSRLHWRNYDLKRFLSAWYASPIDINNDVNLALEGEQRFGNGRDCGSLVYLPREGRRLRHPQQREGCRRAQLHGGRNQLFPLRGHTGRERPGDAAGTGRRAEPLRIAGGF